MLYCDTFAFEHPDNRRFFNDVQAWLGRKIKVLRSPDYADIYDVFEKTRFLRNRQGARCTTRAGMVRPDADRIGDQHGINHVEIDETWIGGATRGEGSGNHNQTLVAPAIEVKQRKPKEGVKTRRGGRIAGRLRLQVVPNRGAKSLVGFVQDAVIPGSMVVTDGWIAYQGITELGYQHLAAAESGDAQVAEEYLPMVHLIFSNLKGWLRGCHHGVSPQHLQAYLNEFTFRFNRRFYPFNAFRSMLGIGGESQAPTYRELYSGEWEHPRAGVHG